MAKNKEIFICVDEEIALWLDDKVSRGYKKAGLIRHLLRKQMEFEKSQKIGVVQ